jgi:hypothetical protein
MKKMSKVMEKTIANTHYRSDNTDQSISVVYLLPTGESEPYMCIIEHSIRIKSLKYCILNLH